MKVVSDHIFTKSKSSALTSEMLAYYESKGCAVLGSKIGGGKSL